MSTDPRIPVTVLEDHAALPAALAGASAAVLLTGGMGAVTGAAAMAVFTPGTHGHALGCACCAGRSAAAQGLDQLFQARARGQCGWFDRVIALVPDAATAREVSQALRADRVCAARFRRAG